MERHSDRLQSYRPKKLDNVHGQAVNENTNKLYWDMVEDVQLHCDDRKPIVKECTWAFDESAFPEYTGVNAERSIGGTQK